MLRLVAFDMDGTLVDVSSSWAAVHHRFGLSNATALEQFLHDEIDDEEFIRADVRLWKTRRPDLTIQEVGAILDEVPLMPGAAELIGGLKARGIQTAIVSGGIDLLAERIGRELGMDRVFANGIRHGRDGRLTTEGIVRVPIKRKGAVIRRVQQELGISPGETAAVGNSDIDIGMFRESAVGIAFRPEDDATRRAATYVLDGHSLAPALPLLLRSPSR